MNIFEPINYKLNSFRIVAQPFIMVAMNLNDTRTVNFNGIEALIWVGNFSQEENCFISRCNRFKITSNTMVKTCPFINNVFWLTRNNDFELITNPFIKFNSLFVKFVPSTIFCQIVKSFRVCDVNILVVHPLQISKGSSFKRIHVREDFANTVTHSINRISKQPNNINVRVFILKID